MHAQRVIADLRELAIRTSTPDGAQRLAWGPVWRDARAWFKAKTDQLGLPIRTDSAGNNWVTLPGASPKTVIVGSHLDSVPNGGWLDGCLGVRSAGAYPRGTTGCARLRHRNAGRRRLFAYPASACPREERKGCLAGGRVERLCAIGGSHESHPFRFSESFGKACRTGGVTSCSKQPSRTGGHKSARRLIIVDSLSG